MDHRRSGLPLALALLAAGAVASGRAQKAPTKRDLSKGSTLYVVPYAHLDTQWRWAYPQVIREFIPNTMRDNLALFPKYPHYVFNFTGSRRYEMMREYYPEEYARVKAAVKAGRWFPSGSSVDEGDALIPSGESIIRQVLYGNHYFRREFGVASEEFMLPDCFGFPYSLPTLLAHCGVKGFSTQRITSGSAVGMPFKVGTWTGPDGKGVIAALDPGGYTGEVAEDLSQNTSWLARIQNTGKKSGAYLDYHYYGTGDQGGAPKSGSVGWVERSIAGKGPVRVVSARADEMFLSVTPAQRKALPNYRGELLLTEFSTGMLTSQAYMKRWNRKNELLADAAERASVGAMWLGGASYPSARLNKAWGLVLGSQMHDMLPGTSLPRAYDFCWNDEILAMNTFAEVARNAVGTVAAAMDTRAEGTPLVVYNPLSREREDVVEVDASTLPSGIATVYGPDGAAVPTQRSGDKLLFLARVPANGFATFDARPGSAPQTAPEPRVEGRTIENARLRVTVNEAGDIGSIYDKAAKREVLKAPTRLDLARHNPVALPAWMMNWKDAKVLGYAQVGGPARIRVVESGPVRAAIEVDRTTAGSRFVQTIRLSAGGDRVEIAARIDWNTPETALKAAFPFAHPNPKATYDMQVGTVERGNNEERKFEVPQQQWFDLTATDGSYGAAVLNDSKFGSDKPDDATMRLTLLYTPGVTGPFQDQETQDFGRHEILYAIAPHAGDWRAGDVQGKARRLNQPLRAFVVPAHAGATNAGATNAGNARTLSLARTSSDAVEIVAMKRAEDGGEIVVRVRELSGRDAKGVILTMAAPIAAARETDGQERPLGALKPAGGRLTFDLSAYSLRTFALKLAPSATGVAAPASAPVALPYDLDAISTRGHAADGDFDGDGRTFPAEELTPTIESSGTAFRLGSFASGAKNAVAARGQTIALPAGHDRVEFLLASSGADVPAEFRVGDRAERAIVQGWRGFVGAWDQRLWLGEVPEFDFLWNNPLGGLVPAYIKPAEVAWYASHHRKAGVGNVVYDYAKLYRLGFNLPNGARTITLPNDPRIGVFAVSVVRGGHPATPATPLMDALPGAGEGDAPAIVTPDQAAPTYRDTIAVSLRPPLYWRAGNLRYTLDGSPVTAASPVYAGPFLLNAPTTVSVAEVEPSGQVGRVVTRRIEVDDVTPPSVASSLAAPDLGAVSLVFSELVDRASAGNPANYRLAGGGRVLSARLQKDGRSVELGVEGDAHALTVEGVRDLAPRSNALPATAIEPKLATPIFAAPAMVANAGAEYRPEGLPRRAGQSWTINLLVKPDKEIAPLTILAGFGRATDGETGTGRYFVQIGTGVQFWVANLDVTSGVPYDIGRWQMLTATYDGAVLSLYKDGRLVGARAIELVDDEPVARSAPLDAWERKRRFSGGLDAFTIWNGALPPGAVARLYARLKRD